MGLYPTNSLETNKLILEDCKANIVVVENADMTEQILKIKNGLPELQLIIQWSGAVPESCLGVMSWENVMEVGTCNPDNRPVEERHLNMSINECCILIYTSGTTGSPKGNPCSFIGFAYNKMQQCSNANYTHTFGSRVFHIISGVMHSHDSVYCSAVTLSKKMMKLKDNKEVMVSYLPLSHAAANCLDMWVVFVSRGTIAFADKLALKGSLVQTLQEVRPTVFFAVPRVYEKIVEAIRAKNVELNGVKKMMFKMFTKAGIKHHSVGTNYMTYTIGKTIFYNKLLAAMGLDRCDRFYVSGAPIASQTYQYLLGLDIVVQNCYGMSEGGMATCEYNGHKPGSTGSALPGVTVKIENKDDRGIGEVCYWGRQVMMGYLNNECKTHEAIDEKGVLHTGDLGFLDDDDYLFLTGT